MIITLSIGLVVSLITQNNTPSKLLLSPSTAAIKTSLVDGQQSLHTLHLEQHVLSTRFANVITTRLSVLTTDAHISKRDLALVKS